VHRVGADDEGFGPAIWSLRAASIIRAFKRPQSPVFWKFLDLLEFEGVEDEAGRARAAEPLLDAGVDEPVIVDRRVPGHAADESRIFMERSFRSGEAIMSAGGAGSMTGGRFIEGP